MTRTLVLGGAGFIGSHLVDKLLDRGDEVVVVDNLNTGSLQNLQKHPNLKVFTAGIEDNIERHFKKTDIVYHLAALTRPQYSIEHPLESNIANVDGTLKVLKHASDKKVSRFVFVSSSSLYGTPELFPTPEQEIQRSICPYALQKYIGEEYCHLFERMYKMKINIVRPFNVYGSRQNPNGGYSPAVPTFIRNLRKMDRCYITGDGKQARDFIHVDDVVDLLLLLGTSKVVGETFNAGSGKSTSINEIYQTISEIMGVDMTPEYIEPLFEPKQTLANIGKAEIMLGWKPKVELRDGLRKTIKETKYVDSSRF